MPTCVKCGTEISESQFNNFNRMCSECARIFKYEQKKSGKDQLIYGFVLLFMGTWFIIASLFLAGPMNPGLGIGLAIAGILFVLISILLIYKGRNNLKTS